MYCVLLGLDVPPWHVGHVLSMSSLELLWSLVMIRSNFGLLARKHQLEGSDTGAKVFGLGRSGFRSMSGNDNNGSGERSAPASN